MNPKGELSQQQVIPIEYEFQIMADSAPVMIWIAGLDKGCYFFNQVWLHFTGRTLEQEAGNGWAEGVHKDDFDKCLKIYITEFNNRHPFKMEYRLKRHDGEYRWILDNGVPRYDGEGRFAGYIGSCIDIHEMKQAEERKDEFISSASHELKTPVTTLNIYLSLIKDFMEENNFTEQNLFVKKAQDQVHRLNKLVSGLLDVSRIQANIIEMDFQVIDYCAFLKDLMADFQAVNSSHKFTIDICEATIRADKDRLAQVISNLVGNAVKYSTGGQKITIAVTEENEFIKTTVTDYGIGIPKKHHANIFDRFYRVTDKDVKTFPGLGIGLYIASEIIKQHGGKIGVESMEGESTTFWFLLPIYGKNDKDA